LEKKMDYPLVILEGFARGLPAVVGDAPSLLELCTLPGEPAHGVKSDDPDAVARAVVTILNDDKLRRGMGVAARRVAQQRFSPSRMAEAYEQLYDEVLRTR